MLLDGIWFYFYKIIQILFWSADDETAVLLQRSKSNHGFKKTWWNVIWKRITVYRKCTYVSSYLLHLASWIEAQISLIEFDFTVHRQSFERCILGSGLCASSEKKIREIGLMGKMDWIPLNNSKRSETVNANTFQAADWTRAGECVKESSDSLANCSVNDPIISFFHHLKQAILCSFLLNFLHMFLASQSFVLLSIIILFNLIEQVLNFLWFLSCSTIQQESPILNIKKKKSK